MTIVNHWPYLMVGEISGCLGRSNVVRGRVQDGLKSGFVVRNKR
jgi:hypothetical protein